jgi:hypothetical protein
MTGVADPGFEEREAAAAFTGAASATGALPAGLPVDAGSAFATGAAGLSVAQLKSCSASVVASEGAFGAGLADLADLVEEPGFDEVVAGFVVDPDSDAVRSRMRTCFAAAGAGADSSASTAGAASSAPFAEKYSVDFEADRADFEDRAVCRSHSANGFPS